MAEILLKSGLNPQNNNNCRACGTGNTHQCRDENCIQRRATDSEILDKYINMNLEIPFHLTNS